PGDGVQRALVVRRRHREGQVGGLAVGGDVLDDHVDVDVGFRERTENCRGHARLVLYLTDGNLRLVAGEGDAGDCLLFHDLVLFADEGSGRILVRVDVLGAVETRAHEDAHVM